MEDTEFALIVSDLLAQNINKEKCWNDGKKSLFAIILDYGPALLMIVREKVGGPTLQTAYSTPRCRIQISTKLTKSVCDGSLILPTCLLYSAICPGHRCHRNFTMSQNKRKLNCRACICAYCTRHY